jgi:hypothetical protein
MSAVTPKADQVPHRSEPTLSAITGSDQNLSGSIMMLVELLDQSLPREPSWSRNALASLRSALSNPSVNQL